MLLLIHWPQLLPEQKKTNKQTNKKTDKLTNVFITSEVLPLQTVDDEMYVEGFNQKTAIRSRR